MKTAGKFKIKWVLVAVAVVLITATTFGTATAFRHHGGWHHGWHPGYYGYHGGYWGGYYGAWYPFGYYTTFTPRVTVWDSYTVTTPYCHSCDR